MNSSWQIAKDNTLRVNPYEMRRLKDKRHLTDRTLHIECGQYPVMDNATAKLIATLALSDAVIGHCGKINVRGKRWNWEFDVKELNKSIEKRWGGRSGMVQNPAEKVSAGCFYDEVKKLWQVPRSQVRETITFPPRSNGSLEGEK